MALHDWCFESWREFHGRPPLWSKVEYMALAKVIKAVDEPTLKAAWTTFLECDEPFFSGHPPRKFLFDIDRFICDSQRVRGLPLDKGTQAVVDANTQLTEYWERRSREKAKNDV